MDPEQALASVILARSTPSIKSVSPDKMALLTLGDGNGAVIENGWQGERGENP